MPSHQHTNPNPKTSTPQPKRHNPNPTTSTPQPRPHNLDPTTSTPQPQPHNPNPTTPQTNQNPGLPVVDAESLRRVFAKLLDDPSSRRLLQQLLQSAEQPFDDTAFEAQVRVWGVRGVVVGRIVFFGRRGMGAGR